ncbi:MAG: alpha/beta hydrolase fold protein [Verrucomicrobiales bacterium]|nr:alpha/beta hydrolase fold protein [Verrucomicrobiales bacterium]
MTLHFQTFGSGFPLVILHGLFGSSDNWQSLSKRLAQQFQVYAVDLRNHGNSPHADEFNYVVMAEDLREFFATHGISSAHLLGHSMGGKAAIQFARMFPDLVEKLVVVDIAPKKYPRSHDSIFAALFSIDPGSFTTRSAVDQALAPQIPDPAVRHFLLKNLATAENGSLKWKLNLPAIQKHYVEISEAPPATQLFSKPTLFIRGGKSQYVDAQDEPLIQVEFPKARIVTIPEADHWVHADAPHEFLRILLSFLQD